MLKTQFAQKPLTRIDDCFSLFSFETIQKSFVGVHKAIQANFESDLEQQAVEEILTANDRR